VPKSKENDGFSEAVPSHANAAKVAKTPFHGDNTGSNPVGDANKTKDFWILCSRASFERDAIVTS
jgi:hypothetical protein